MLSQQLPMLPGQTPGIINPALQSQQPGFMQQYFQQPGLTPPGKSFISPAMGGWLAGIAAGLATYYAMSKIPAGKGKTQIVTSNKVKIPAAVAVGFVIKQGVKKKLEEKEAAKYNAWLLNQQFGGMQLPTGNYTLPPGTFFEGEQSTAGFDPDRKAGEFIIAYNPDGWVSDREAAMKTLQTVPPQYFSIVANSYLRLYNRNLLTDLDYLFNNFAMRDTWTAYRTQLQ